MGYTITLKLLRNDSCNLTKNTLMYSYQLAALLCLVLGMISCSSSDFSDHINHAELEGHWNITVPSGLMFVEFTSDQKVLIGDRGAIGEKDISLHYFQEYKIPFTRRHFF